MAKERPFVAVIDPAMRVAETDCFNRMARVSPVPLTYHLPGLQNDEELPPVTRSLLGAVILGSGASVHESFAWQDRLANWVETLASAKIPVLGICYGHQLLARVFGGKVEFVNEDHSKEKGIRFVDFSAGFPGSPELRRAALIVSHREEVSQCPRGFEVVARSGKIGIEAMRHTTLPIVGVQAHPEATPTFVRNQDLNVPPSFDYSEGHTIVDRFLTQQATRRSE